MKTVVIDSIEKISVFGSTGSTPELVEISGDGSERNCDALDAFERLVTSLELGIEVEHEFLDLGTEIFTFAERSGFRRGFRLGARLILETLGAPEPPGRSNGHSPGKAELCPNRTPEKEVS